MKRRNPRGVTPLAKVDCLYTFTDPDGGGLVELESSPTSAHVRFAHSVQGDGVTWYAAYLDRREALKLANVLLDWVTAQAATEGMRR